MLALDRDLGVVIGVDTHKHTHTAAAVGPTGAVLEHLTVPADPAGYRHLIAFGQRHDVSLWAIEGTGCFGAGLTTALLARCDRIVEVDRPQRPARRGGVKSDDIDAVRAARQALAGVGLSEPRSRGDREAIRVLLTTRAQAVEFRTQAISALHALVTSAPDGLRERLCSQPLGQLLRICAGLRDSSRRSVEESATVLAMRSTARRALACQQEAAELEDRLDRLVHRLAPELLDQLGIGPVAAGQVITSWSHHGRVLRQARRRRPHRGIVGNRQPAPIEQIRRSTAQSGPAHDRAGPHASRRGDKRLRPAPPRRRQDHPRDQTVPEALCRPTAISPARSAAPNRLTKHRSVPLGRKQVFSGLVLIMRSGGWDVVCRGRLG